MSRKVKKPAKPKAPPRQNGVPDDHCSKVRYDVAFEFALECQVLTDKNGIILNVNRSGVAYLRAHKGFLIDKPLGLLFKPNGHSHFYWHLGQINLGMPSCYFESRIQPMGGGAPRLVQVTGIVTNPTCIHWSIHDKTELEESEEARMELLRRLIAAQDDERHRLARDLHDNVGQLLTALRMSLTTVEDSMPPLKDQPSFVLVKRMADDLNKVLHRLAYGLRSGLVSEAGLHAAVTQLVGEWKGHERAVKLEFLGDTIVDLHLAAHIETSVYALIQEALTNIFRHSKAETARITIERTAFGLEVTVEDDGVGFDLAVAQRLADLGHLGLVGMRERMALIGATVRIDTGADKGTTITAEIPITSPPGTTELDSEQKYITMNDVPANP